MLDSKSSRRHATIECRQGKFFIRDEGSRNGTWVNERSVKDAVLRNGDKIYIGDTIIEFVENSFTPPVPEPNSITGGTTGSLTLVIRSGADDSAVHFDGEEFDLSRGDILAAEDKGDIEILRLYNQKLRRVYEINKALSSLMALPELLEYILEILFEILPVERGVIFLKEKDKGFLPVASRTKRGEASGELPVSQTLLSKVVNERIALLSGDLMRDNRFSPSESIVVQGITSCLTVPMIYRDNVLGIIYLDTVGSYAAFSREDLEIVSGIASQAAVAIENARLFAKVEQEAVIRQNLKRYLPGDVVDSVMAGDMDFSMEGEMKLATVLFADIRGFTSLSERFPPQLVVQLLNGFFEIMVDVIHRQGGVVDKFVGDEIMAVWGVPAPKSDDAFQAVSAAIRMQQSLCSYNERRRAMGEEPIFMGIGINTGTVVAGNLGSSQRMQYTVIGDAVNLASRLEGLTSRGEVLISRATFELVQDRIRTKSKGLVDIKGKSEPVPVYKVLGLIDTAARELGRKHDRFKTALPVKCLRVKTNRLFSGVLLDISPGGAGVRFDPGDVDSLQTGERIVLGFVNPQKKKILVKGDIVRLMNAAGRQDGLCIMGMAFDESEEYVEQVIENVVIAAAAAEEEEKL